jgi:large subunit ribosomal protein L18
MASKKTLRRLKIKRSIRKRISGTADRPRLSVYRSNSAIYAQLIDDVNGNTLAAVSSKEILGDKSVNVDAAKEVGKGLAEKAKVANIESVVFDRNGFLYHGKVKALAEGAREGGLKF